MLANLNIFDGKEYGIILHLLNTYKVKNTCEIDGKVESEFHLYGCQHTVKIDSTVLPQHC